MWNSKVLLPLIHEFSTRSIKLLALALVAVCCYVFLFDLHILTGNLHLLARMPFETQISMFHVSEAALRPLTICIALGFAFRVHGRTRREPSLEWYTTWMMRVFGIKRPERFLPAIFMVVVCLFISSFVVAGYSFWYAGGGAIANLSARCGFFELGELLHEKIRVRSAAEFGHSTSLQLAYEDDISGDVGGRIESAICNVYGPESLELARVVESRGDDHFVHHRDFAKAELQYNKALTLYRKNKNMDGICDVLSALAEVQLRQHRSDEARISLLSALSMITSSQVVDSYALSLMRWDAEKLGVWDQYQKAMAIGRERRVLWRDNRDPLLKYGNVINNALIISILSSAILFRGFAFWCLEKRLRKAFRQLQTTNHFSQYFDTLVAITELELLRNNLLSADLSSRAMKDAAESQKVLNDKLAFVPDSWKITLDLRQLFTPSLVLMLGVLFLQFRYC